MSRRSDKYLQLMQCGDYDYSKELAETLGHDVAWRYALKAYACRQGMCPNSLAKLLFPQYRVPMERTDFLMDYLLAVSRALLHEIRKLTDQHADAIGVRLAAAVVRSDVEQLQRRLVSGELRNNADYRDTSWVLCAMYAPERLVRYRQPVGRLDRPKRAVEDFHDSSFMCSPKTARHQARRRLQYCKQLIDELTAEARDPSLRNYKVYIHVHLNRPPLLVRIRSRVLRDLVDVWMDRSAPTSAGLQRAL